MFGPSVTARSVGSRPRTTRRHQPCQEGGNSDTFRLPPLHNGPLETFGGKGNVPISLREASPLPGAVSLCKISSTLTSAEDELSEFRRPPRNRECQHNPADRSRFAASSPRARDVETREFSVRCEGVGGMPEDAVAGTVGALAGAVAGGIAAVGDAAARMLPDADTGKGVGGMPEDTVAGNAIPLSASSWSCVLQARRD